MKKYITLLIIIILIVTAIRIYKVNSYQKFEMNDNTLIINNETYKLMLDEEVTILSEDEIVGIAINGKMSVSDFIAPYYIRYVDTSSGKMVMVSTLMWDGLFAKE